MPKKRSEFTQRILHGVAGFVILIKAYDKWDHHDVAIAGALVFIALLFLMYARFHPKLHHLRIAPHLETGVFLAEAAVMALVALSYANHGKRFLPFCYIFVTLMYLVLALRQHLQNRRRAIAHRY